MFVVLGHNVEVAVMWVAEQDCWQRNKRCDKRNDGIEKELMERERANGRLLEEKRRIQSTKHTVLNQQILQPATRQTKNTCNDLPREQYVKL
uniref:Uncharacterized protein n=1 Tax=Oryza brachyantha TaxID=4533 RepID=J3NAP3_ORYBR